MPKKTETADATKAPSGKDAMTISTKTETESPATASDASTVSVSDSQTATTLDNAKAAYEAARAKAETARDIVNDAKSLFSNAEAQYNVSLRENASQDILIDLLTKRDKAQYGVKAAEDRFTALSADADQAEATYRAELRRVTIDQLNVEKRNYEQDFNAVREHWRTVIKEEYSRLVSAVSKDTFAALFTKTGYLSGQGNSTKDVAGSLYGTQMVMVTPILNLTMILTYVSQVESLRQRGIELMNRAKAVGDYEWSVPMPVIDSVWTVWEEYLQSKPTPAASTMNAQLTARVEPIQPVAPPAPLTSIPGVTGETPFQFGN